MGRFASVTVGVIAVPESKRIDIVMRAEVCSAVVEKASDLLPACYRVDNDG